MSIVLPFLWDIGRDCIHFSLDREYVELIFVCEIGNKICFITLVPNMYYVPSHTAEILTLSKSSAIVKNFRCPLLVRYVKPIIL